MTTKYLTKQNDPLGTIPLPSGFLTTYLLNYLILCIPKHKIRGDLFSELTFVQYTSSTVRCGKYIIQSTHVNSPMEIHSTLAISHEESLQPHPINQNQCDNDPPRTLCFVDILHSCFFHLLCAVSVKCEI